MFADISRFWKFLHFLPVIPVYIIIYTVLYTFTVYFLFDGKKISWIKILLSFLFYFLAMMTIICHSLSMLTSPGEVESSANEDSISASLEDINNQEGNQNHCKKCNKSRPERAHHCSTCKKCILKMDHHCPWIANCVGFYNQKAFYLFLFYATFGDLVACICLATKIFDDSFVEYIIRPKRRVNLNADWIILELFYSLKDPIYIIIGACLSFAMTAAIGALFGYQTYLIMSNHTSIESSHFRNKNTSPYYAKKGYKIKAFTTLMGLNKSIFFWFLPIFEKNAYNNGSSYLNLEMNIKEKYN
jgi:hypothetical protein